MDRDFFELQIPLLKEGEEKKARILKIDSICYGVCGYFRIDFDTLIKYNKCRKRIYCEPRQIIIYFAIEKLGYSQREAGNIVGKDHATALKAHRDIINLTEVDCNYRAKIKTIESSFL